MAQFRIEMRLAGRNPAGGAAIAGERPALAVTVPARVLHFSFTKWRVVSAVIQVGLALPMVVYFHRLGLSGLSANAFAIPLMGLAVPAGFLAVFTGWQWMAAVGGWLMRAVARMVGWHAAHRAGLAHSHSAGVAGGGFAAALICFAMARGTLVARGSGRWRWRSS